MEPVGLLRLADLLKMSAPSKSSDLELSRRRSKRSVFLQPGVRICSQESIDEVLASHQTYYQLREPALKAKFVSTNKEFYFGFHPSHRRSVQTTTTIWKNTLE
ncbi:hypothetical protein CRENBAI_005345 [Crenichthys baileyi]|uniref:Uncharacterized protein n=1 Tax=Crenichthys baileyi TaxID=28760 RepID=A0AAV9QMN0_9TELE